MRYWWSNQGATHEASLLGKYIWSPKQSKGGKFNRFFDNMRNVAPGDIVFIYWNSTVGAVGKALSACYPAPKPREYPSDWPYDEGWKVDVAFNRLKAPVRPSDHIDRLGPLLSEQYPPIKASGKGKQEVALVELSAKGAGVLFELLQDEDASKSSIIGSSKLGETEKEQLINARRGQGHFRENVKRFEKGCRVSGIADPQFLRASHIKPWWASTDPERLDGENGLLLSPNIDFLFDRGFISFDDDGTLLISPVANLDCLARLGVAVDRPISCGSFSVRQREFLAYHRCNVFLEAVSSRKASIGKRRNKKG